MPDASLSRAFRVNDCRAAAAFSDPLRRRVVLLLARQERSAGELAAITGVALKRLHYHLGALHRLGLVVVARRRPRAGRAVKLYRAVADAFFVPAEAACASPEDARAAALREAVAKHTDPSREGMLYHLGDGGALLAQPVSGTRAQQAAVADCWRMLQLSPVEARRLAAELDSCLRAAVERSRGATTAYVAHFAFAPRA